MHGRVSIRYVVQCRPREAEGSPPDKYSTQSIEGDGCVADIRNVPTFLLGNSAFRIEANGA